MPTSEPKSLQIENEWLNEQQLFFYRSRDDYAAAAATSPAPMAKAAPPAGSLQPPDGTMKQLKTENQKRWRVELWNSEMLFYFKTISLFFVQASLLAHFHIA